MNAKNPYFSVTGAFQTPGDPIEAEINTTAAMKKLHTFAMTGANQDEAMFALGYLEDQYSKLQICCDHMRIAFLMDITDDHRMRLARKAYNCLVDRFNQTPLR